MFLTESASQKNTGVTLVDIYEEMLSFQESFETLKFDIILDEHEHALCLANSYLSEAEVEEAKQSFGAKIKEGAGKVWVALKNFWQSVVKKFSEIYNKIVSSIRSFLNLPLAVDPNKEVPNVAGVTDEALRAIDAAARKSEGAEVDPNYAAVWEEALRKTKEPSKGMVKASDEYAADKKQLGEISAKIDAANRSLKVSEAKFMKDINAAEAAGESSKASAIRGQMTKLSNSKAKEIQGYMNVKSRLESSMKTLTAKMKKMNDEGKNG